MNSCAAVYKLDSTELVESRYEVIAGFDSNDAGASVNGLAFVFSGMILRKH